MQNLTCSERIIWYETWDGLYAGYTVYYWKYCVDTDWRYTCTCTHCSTVPSPAISMWDIRQTSIKFRDANGRMKRRRRTNNAELPDFVLTNLYRNSSMQLLRLLLLGTWQSFPLPSMTLWLLFHLLSLLSLFMPIYSRDPRKTIILIGNEAKNKHKIDNRRYY